MSISIFASLLCAFTLQTSLYDLLGERASELPEAARGKGRNLMLVVSPLAREFATNAVAEVGAEEIPLWRVTEEDADLLTSVEGRAKIARRALRRYLASPLPPLFGVERDPFGLRERWVMSMATSSEAVVPVRLSDEVVDDIDKLADFINQERLRAQEFYARTGVKVQLTGLPVHTAITAEKCRRQIKALTWFSLAFIALLSIVVFRSLKWLPLFAATLLVSAASGFLALYLLFDEVHILTLVFGTTVLGLVIDYSFHRIFRTSMRTMVMSFITTEACFLPLLLSSLPILRQSAVFLAFALGAALVFVWIGFPKRALLALALSAVIFTGCDFIRTDPEAIYQAPKELAEVDRKLAERFGMVGIERAEIECRLKNIERLYVEQLPMLRSALSLPPMENIQIKESVPVDSRELLSGLLKELTDETVKRLGIALGVIIILIGVVFRRRMFRMLLPSALSLALIAALVIAVDGRLNLFHLLAMFILLGMSMDYTIFLYSGEGLTLKPVVCSLLTSMAGFGALYFVSFPAVSAFGMVLGPGLPMAFLVAYFRSRRLRAKSQETSVELAASPWGLEILLFIYRLLGLSVLRLMAEAVGAVVWVSSAKVRKAVPNSQKLRFFVRSLADKLVVMAEGKDLPEVAFEETSAAREFIAEVSAGKGVFVLSTHVGTIEVLSAAAKVHPRFHAWMDFERTSVFNRFYLRHATGRSTVIHPVSEISLDTAFTAGEWLDNGECLLMAGDRGEGAFRFARAMRHSVYAVACIAEGHGYRIFVNRLGEDLPSMKREYFEFRETLALRFPAQVFEWG